MIRPFRVARHAALGALLLAALAACGGMPRLGWPWGAKAQPAPEIAHELAVSTTDGAPLSAFPQYWKRNTVVVDMQAVASSGEIVLRPREPAKWPARLALRLTPGRVGTVEVRGDERLLLPIAPEGSQPVDLEIAPSVYSPETEHITVRWGAESGCCVESPTDGR